MAVGIFPKYVREISLNELTSEQFLAVALDTALFLHWNISYFNDQGFVAYSGYSIGSWGEEIKANILENSVCLQSVSVGVQIYDWGKNKRNIESFVSAFYEIRASFSTDQLSKKYAEWNSTLADKANDEVIHQSPLTTSGKLRGLFSIFKPVEGYFITPLIIDLNILILILMALSGVSIFIPDGPSLIKWGANFRPVTLDGGWWRLLTCCFVHMGIFHLLMNMYALLYIGVILEPYLGKIRFLYAYLLTGFVASLTSLCWHNLTVSVGASGAIFGLYGVFLAMLTTNLIERKARKALLISIAVFVGYNLINGLKPGIDNSAHVGGLVSGLIVGYSFYATLKKPTASGMKYSIMGLLTLITLISSIVIIPKIPNDIGVYDKQIKKFLNLESRALEIFRLPADTPKSLILDKIRTQGLYNWKRGLELITAIDTLNIPEKAHETDQELIQYCNLRISAYNLLYKAFKEDTKKYNDSIIFYNQQIALIIYNLKKEQAGN